MNPLLLALLLAQNTPNMSLCTVNPGVDSLVTTQNCINQNANTIDAHNHSSGEGTTVPVAGINIHASVPFNGYPVSGCGYMSAVDAGAGPSLVRTLWNDGIDWWVEDGSGNKIKLTSGGAINVVLGDGGTYTFQNITVITKATIGSTSISGTCLYGPYGAEYCFDSSGNIVEATADAGTGITINDYAGDALYLLNGTATMNSAGLGAGWFCGLSGCAVQFVDTIGLDSSFHGYIEESGNNVQMGAPDGGGFHFYSNGITGATADAFDFRTDGGGTIPFKMTGSGSPTFGDPAGDALQIVPQGLGQGHVSIVPASNVSGGDVSVSLWLAPKGGDGGLGVFAHIDTANSNSAVTGIQVLNPACFGDAGYSLVSNSNDTSGIIQITMGPTSASCSIGTQIVGVYLANAYAPGTTSYSVQLTPFGNVGGISPALPALSAWEVDGGLFVIENNAAVTPETGSVTYGISYSTLGLGSSAH